MNKRLLDTQRKKNLSRDKLVQMGLLVASLLSILFVGMIVFEMVVKGATPFLPSYTVSGHPYPVSVATFLTGSRWVMDRINSYYLFGAGFLIFNTIYTVMIAITLSFPLALFSSLYIVKMANKWMKRLMETAIEMLAAIPSIIYGVFGSTQLVLLVRNLGDWLGISTAGGLSILATSLTLAVMITPTLASVMMVAIKAVDPSIENASVALGASKIQTLIKVDIPAARSGIFAGVILGVGRALGEATAVAMVSGNANFGPSFNLFSITSTLASKMLVGIKEASGVTYDIRFSLGLVLIILLFSTNLILSVVKKKVRK
ncbi:MAG: phosphate ABC transporter permease subunit PstC [Bacilli bacterium]